MNLRLGHRSKPENESNGLVDPIDVDLESLLEDRDLLDAVLEKLDWSATDSPEELAARASELDEVIGNAKGD